MLRKWGTALLTAALAISVAACGTNKDNGGVVKDPAQAAGDAKTGKEAASKRTTYPFTVKDSSGKEFTFAKAPERIVSLSPTETEVLFALGLGNKIVGVSNLDDYPEEAKSKPKMGNLQGNPEAIIAANPDVVFAGLSLNKNSVNKLNELKMNLFQTNPKTVDQAIERVLLFGQITDTQEQAEKIAEQMRKEKQQVVDALKSLKPEQRKNVYIEFSPGWTVGRGEFMDDLITLAGGVNVASDLEGWKQISEEKVIQSNPDVIFFAKAVPDLEKTIRGRSGWDKIAAIQANKVIGLDDNLLSRPGPRITKALAEMAKSIYPDLVK
ncbi:ABC transporter substrate-binding protein [Paenibacillus flagellatus]|uniref:ABC transporter substrate-binding protein n=1 Tax=Paenibacillus flagellatus TaxID=2211139 RepID=UPI001FE484B8|nr:helical backbone metal receptor [Paenibacillus flagellatus]